MKPFKNKEKPATLFNSLRMKEIFLMTGFSFAGVLFTKPEEWDNWIKNTSVILFVLFYVMTVYFLNSFADYENDKQSQRLKFIGNVSKSNYVLLFVVFALLFSFTAWLINITVLVCSLLSLLLWCLYYLPPLRLKSTFLVGTVIHFIAGIFHFHSGYCSYAAFSKHSVMISVFFALLLSTGHFHHELMDYEPDKNSGSKTTAVRIGIGRIHLLRTLLAGISLLYWVLLYIIGVTGKKEFVLFLVPVAVLFIMSAVMREKEGKRFQKISRTIFFIAGCLLLLSRIFISAQ